MHFAQLMKMKCAAGSTSAQAAERLGLQRVFWPESPGLEGFVDSIAEALEACSPAPALL